MTGDTPAAVDPLALLLRRLGPSPDAGGEAYESLRRLLQRFFEARGCPDAATLCDEVLDRVGGRLVDGLEIANVNAYAHGVARLVYLEAGRRPAASSLEDMAIEPAAPAQAAPDPMTTCLDACLDRLDAGTRRQVLTYYTADGRGRIDGRRQLAGELGVSATALRIRMLRARLALEQCVHECLARGGQRNTRGPGSTYR